jgi:hypothetical protein
VTKLGKKESPESSRKTDGILYFLTRRQKAEKRGWMLAWATGPKVRHGSMRSQKIEKGWKGMEKRVGDGQ